MIFMCGFDENEINRLFLSINKEYILNEKCDVH